MSYMDKGSEVCGGHRSGNLQQSVPRIGFNVFFNKINNWYRVPQATNSIEIKMIFFICCRCIMP